MQQGSEAYKQEPYPNEDTIPEEEKKRAVILQFPQRANENTEGRKEQTFVRSYEDYEKLGGKLLSKEEYQSVLDRAADVRNAPSSSTISQATLYADNARIALSPKTVTFYGILRNDKMPNPAVKDHYTTKDDQQLLAEALRMSGDTHSLATFIDKHRNILN